VLHEFVSALQRKIDERLENLSSDLAGGCARDYADYRRIVGGISELKAFRKVIREELIKFIKDEDDDG
jgi:actin-like ATPase involved in cell morphogenesis